MYHVPSANSNKPLRDLYAEHYLQLARPEHGILGVGLFWLIARYPEISVESVTISLLVGACISLFLGFIAGLAAAMLCRLVPLRWFESRWFSALMTVVMGIATFMIVHYFNISRIWVVDILASAIVMLWAWLRSRVLPSISAQNTAFVESLKQKP